MLGLAVPKMHVTVTHLGVQYIGQSTHLHDMKKNHWCQKSHMVAAWHMSLVTKLVTKVTDM